MAVMMWLPSRAHAIRRTPNRTLTALSNRPDHGLWCARRWRGSADDGESAGPERGRGCGAGGILEPERALPPERSRQHAGPTPGDPGNTPDPLDRFGQSGGLPLVVGTERLPFGAALPGPQTRRRDRRADRAIGRIDALVDEEHQTLPAGCVDLPHSARR